MDTDKEDTDREGERIDVLRRILDHQTVPLDELADVMFPKEHIAAISRRCSAGLYGSQCGRDVSDLLQQNLFLSHTISQLSPIIQRLNQMLEDSERQMASTAEQPPPRRRLPWMRRK